MNWTVRRQKPEDQQALADIYLTVRRNTFVWVDPAAFHPEDFAVHSKGEIVFVCENEDGEIAGFLALWEPDDFIHMLYVHEKAQHSGVGTLLLEALQDWKDRPYRLKCLVKNTRAKQFYLGKGFRVTGSGTSVDGEYDDLKRPARKEAGGSF